LHDARTVTDIRSTVQGGYWPTRSTRAPGSSAVMPTLTRTKDGPIGPTPVSYRAYTRGDRRRNRSERSSRRLSRRQSPVGCSIKQVFVAAMIACSVYTGRLSRRRLRRQSPRVYTTGDRRGDDRSDSRGDDRPSYTPLVVMVFYRLSGFKWLVAGLYLL